MRYIEKSEAQDIIGPYAKKLIRAITNGVERYFSGDEYTVVRHSHTPRSDASICHDLIVEKLCDEFEGVQGARFFKIHGLFLLQIEGAIALRFNKFNDQFLTGYNPTQQTLAFESQRVEQLEFPEFPPRGLLICGYQINRLRTKVEGVYVVYRKKRRNLWVWDLREGQDESISPAVTFLQPPPQPPLAPRRIHPKGLQGGHKTSNDASE